MLYRTNLIAYVPADHVTGLPSNVGKRTNGFFCSVLVYVNILVNVYDDERKSHVLELCFNLSVVSIRMSRTRFENKIDLFDFFNLFFYNRLIVVLVSKIHILSFPNQCRLLHTIETRDNPRGKSMLFLIEEFNVVF
jgi:hypothetical protein